MIYEIKSESLVAKINSLGAELVGCKGKDEYEYIYQTTPLWLGQSKNQFPNIGTLDGEYILVKGEKYPAPQHGFAKDMEYTATQISESEIHFMLESNSETKKYLPYDFKYHIEFKIQEDTITQTFRAENTSAEEMFFALGTHTGYTATEGSYLDFGNNTSLLKVERINMQYLTGKYDVYPVNRGILEIMPETYNHGADILAGFNKQEVILRNRNHNHYAKVNFTGFQYLGLWAPMNSQIAVSIMPWCGLPEMKDTNHKFEEKFGNVWLDAGKSFEVTLNMTFGVE